MAFDKNNNSIFYIPHGGGPLQLLNEFMFHSMNQFLRKIPDLVRKPEAIIIISAHWEELTISITANQNPPMY
jgi:4,5-DOPA dioxygenase extradiol